MCKLAKCMNAKSADCATGHAHQVSGCRGRRDSPSADETTFLPLLSGTYIASRRNVERVDSKALMPGLWAAETSLCSVYMIWVLYVFLAMAWALVSSVYGEPLRARIVWDLRRKRIAQRDVFMSYAAAFHLWECLLLNGFANATRKGARIKKN